MIGVNPSLNHRVELRLAWNNQNGSFIFEVDLSYDLRHYYSVKYVSLFADTKLCKDSIE
jgi:hypothetical protein